VRKPSARRRGYSRGTLPLETAVSLFPRWASLPRTQRPAPAAVDDFGTLLKRLRLQAELSQEQLAERARISTKAIGSYERGERRAPHRDTLALIVEALGVTGTAYDELLYAANLARRRGPTAVDFASPGEFPAQPNNLPIARTTFVGREHDVAEVTEMLGRYRLLTLVGSGGVGKTRLAIAVGAELLDRYPDGVWFVDFAPITDPKLVASVVAQALGKGQHQGQRIDEAIPAWLKRKHLLLILDNAEHLLEATATFAEAVLATTQDVRILTTSRQSLNISGEAVHQVQPLAVPAETAGLKVREALGYGAVSLFVDRATAADTRFLLTDENASIIAEICRGLDGIPLAIELAAARVKVLSIPNVARRLNERFKLLTGGSRSVLPRQKTLTALIDWSYDLLAEHERLLFVRLGIFTGGFGLDAVTAVCGGDGLDGVDTFDLLASLTDKSLVIADTRGERERYRLLESTAAYALEKLIALRRREGLARRHAEYFRQWAEAADELRSSASKSAWLADMELELDNYRTALEWALTQENDAVLGGAIAGALGGLWSDAGLVAEGRYWIKLALPRVNQSEHPAIAASLQLALSGISDGKRRYEAAELAMQLYESVGDLGAAARAQRMCGFALYQMGRLDEARKVIAQALAASSGATWHAAENLNLLAIIEMSRGDLRASRGFYAQSLERMKTLGDELGTARVLGNTADLAFAEGNPEQALRLINEALALASVQKNRLFKASWHNNAAAYCLALGDVSSAREAAREALRLARQIRHEVFIAIALQHFALIAALDGDPRYGAQLLGYVDGRYDHLGVKREPTEQYCHDKLLAALHEALRKDEITRLAAEGRAWSEEEAVETAGLL
jgi:predicted ATPase/transcriptional regulator with XRE-family HTH domain